MKDYILNNVKRFMEEMHLTQRALATMLELSPQTVNNQLTGKCPISLDLIIGMLSNFQDLSAEWLIRGKGTMFGGEVVHNENTLHATSIKESNLNLGGTQTISGGDQSEKIKELEERNKKLEARVDNLIAALAKG